MLALLASAAAFTAPLARAPQQAAPRAAVALQFGFFGGGGGNEPNARDADFAKRQDKLAARQAKAKELPKGSVEVTVPQKGNKVVVAKQGEPIGKVGQVRRIPTASLSARA